MPFHGCPGRLRTAPVSVEAGLHLAQAREVACSTRFLEAWATALWNASAS